MWLYVSILLERGKFYTDSKECPAIGRGILYATFLPNMFDRVTLVCLLSRYPLILLMLVLYVIKEGFMLVMGAVKLREGKKLNGAKWFGKCCTALLFVVLFLLLLFPHMSLVTVNLLILLCAAAMLITLLLYIPVFRSM